MSRLRDVFLSLKKVKESSKLDPCLTPTSEIEEQLKSLVVGKNNKVDGYLNEGKISQAAQLALSVIKTANVKPVCGKGLSLDTKTTVRPFQYPFR